MLILAKMGYNIISTMEVWKEVMIESRFPPVFCCQNIDEHFFGLKTLVIFCNIHAIIDIHFFDHKTLVFFKPLYKN